MKLKQIIALFLLMPVLFVPVHAIEFDAEEIFPSVVVLYSGKAMGSGFALGRSCIVTNAHVLEDREDIKVSLYQGSTYLATLLAVSDTLDLAVLQINGVTLPYLETASVKDLKLGADVYAIGAPHNMSYTLTKGILSARKRELSGREYIQTDASINSGNSGGPLLNEHGAVIGINTLKLADSEGIGLAIPIERVTGFLSENNLSLTSSGELLGVEAIPVSTETAIPYEIPSPPLQSEQERYPVNLLRTQLMAMLLLYGDIFLFLLLFFKLRTPRTPVSLYSASDDTEQPSDPSISKIE